MGKFVKESKVAAEVPLLEISSHSAVALGGVRTRAKTLALRRLRRSSRNPSSPSSSAACYLELRSRRLPKPRHLPAKLRNRPRKQVSGESPNFQLIPEVGKGRTSRRSSRAIGGSGSVLPSFEEVQSSGCHGHLCDSGQGSEGRTEPAASVGSSSGGENGSRSGSDQQRDRLPAPFAARRRLVGGSTVLSGVPTADEIEEFFVLAEREQQRLFIEKYNFDILSDAPLLGRYEWVHLRP